MRIRTSLLLPLLLAIPTLQAAVPKEDLDEQGRGIIQDYGDMKEGGDIEWVWIAPGTKLSSYRYNFTKFENLSKSVDDDMEEVFQKVLPRSLARATRADDKAPTLSVESAVYWTQRANMSKLWIPYAGGHLAQAGVGVELVFKDASGKIVAKIRHSGREGTELKAAAEELVDDLTDYVHNN
jgi:hypothetical protein